MRISLKSVLNKIIWLLTIFLLVSFLIFETYTWGRYAFFGASILAVALSAIAYGGVLRIRLQPYYGFAAVFIAYVAFTSLWSWRSSTTVGVAISLLQIVGCAAMLYIHYDQQDDIWALLSAIKWAGYIVSVYAINFYGLEGLGLEEGERLESEFANINSIGMTAALACVIQVHELLCKKSRWSALMMIPAVIMVAATQSRKALVYLIVGVLGIYVVNSLMQRGFSKKIWRTVFSVFLVLGAFYMLLQLPVFAGLMERMESMLASWTGEGKADSSAVSRNKMVALGWEYFLKYPIGGIGIGSSSVLTQRFLGRSTYLHNNYVELLSGGGIFAFIFYYATHVYVLVNLFKYRKADPQAFAIGLVWMALILIMDYGAVSYAGKTRWYYLMIHCLNIGCMKKKSMVMEHEA